jgi:Fe2+ transport system protein A
MTLKDLKVGQEGIVASVNTTGPIKRRIMEMGITQGVCIKVVKVAPLGDPIEIKVRNYELSIRKKEAEQIILK